MSGQAQTYTLGIGLRDLTLELIDARRMLTQGRIGAADKQVQRDVSLTKNALLIDLDMIDIILRTIGSPESGMREGEAPRSMLI